MGKYSLQSTIAQAQTADSAQPLINQGDENLIYIGVAILAVILILAVGAISRNFEKALVFAFLAAVGMIIAIFVL